MNVTPLRDKTGHLGAKRKDADGHWEGTDENPLLRGIEHTARGELSTKGREPEATKADEDARDRDEAISAQDQRNREYERDCVGSDPEDRSHSRGSHP
jgi:hypothetical protein